MLEKNVLISVSNFMVDNGLKRETAERNVRNIRYFLKYNGDEDPSAWYRSFLEREVSSSYKYQMYYAIKWFLRFKGEDWQFKRPKHHQSSRQNLSIEKCWALLDHTKDDEHRLMIETALLTGLRPSELMAITTANIDFYDNQINVRNSKTYRDRSIPISLELAQKLQRWIYKNKITGRIFPYNPDWFAKIVRDSSKAAGFHATPYMFRHTFATMYIKNGGNLIMLKNIMGHSSIAMVENYMHSSRKMIKNDYEKARPRLFV